MSEQRVTRRAVLGGTVAAAVGLAGCSGGGTASGGSGSTDEPTGTATAGGSGGATDAVEEYLSETDNFDGVVDKTGASEVTVTVGAEANGGNFGFSPPAVRVASGTTVVWKWNGRGAAHNVVDKDGSFESKLTDEKGHTFSQTFEESGIVQYYCRPHRTMGMKGVVVVE